MERIIRISQNILEMSMEVAGEFSRLINNSGPNKVHFTAALSGGNTPKQFFSVLGNHFINNTRWDIVDFFWSDERCVPPDNSESNYKMAKELFLDKIKLSSEKIHRIKGENIPEKEAERYARVIKSTLTSRLGFPVFDVIFLGLGEDGHIASIFPGDEKVINSEKICEVTLHPVSGQKRITLTLPVINNAQKVIFMVSGAGKAKIVAEILNNQGSRNYPAGMVHPYSGKLYWFLDLESSSLLSQLA